MKRLTCLFAAVALALAAGAASKVELKDRSILVDGKKTRILAGTMHYFRVPRACWRDRMEKGKAMGLNAIETYMCWNLHERREGQFDFADNLDFEAYVKLAQELGMYVILRPGPYICSEWDNGGIPSWLMTKPGDALYVPASMLKKGENRLVVFETEKLSAPLVEFGAVRNW